MSAALDVAIGLARAARAKLYRLHWRARSAGRDTDLWRSLELLEETQFWPRPRLERLRDAKLASLVAHLYRVSPGYCRLMDERGVTPEAVRGVADIDKLPIMTKALLREQAAALRATDVPDEQIEWGVTGGTSGVPMRIPRDLVGTPWMRAAYWRGLGWGGLALGVPWAQLFGGALGQQQVRPQNRLKNWFAGKTFLPAFQLNDRNVAEYAEAVRDSGARFLVGYASACNQLAAYVERAGLKVQFDAVFPTAELLLEDWEARLTRVFGAKVMPYYGCGEVQSLAYSCPEVRGVYHTTDEHAVLEVERADGSTGFEGEGAFLITDLDNWAMPLIRYRTGDAGRLEGPGCSCGRTLARISRLDGRVNDVLLTTTGATISGVLGAHALRSIGGVDAFQLIQRRPGHAVIRIVRGAAYDARAAEQELRGIFTDHLGTGSEVAFEYVAELPRTAAGKSRFVINEHLAGLGRT
jgi:phenylacetate-CoA ligase